MAIDTLDKRNSVLSVNSYILPIPDGAVNRNDRQTLLRVVGSILADALAVVARRFTRIAINIGLNI